MKPCRTRPRPPRHTPYQRGAVLVVSLVLVGLLALVGLGGLRHATLEESMAANRQIKSITFQGAETAIREVVRGQGTVLNAAVSAGTATPVTGNYNASVGAGVTSGASTQYTGVAPAPNTSLGLEESSLADFRFTVTGTSTVATASATSVNQQGIARIGPAAGAGIN